MLALKLDIVQHSSSIWSSCNHLILNKTQGNLVATTGHSTASESRIAMQYSGLFCFPAWGQDLLQDQSGKGLPRVYHQIPLKLPCKTAVTTPFGWFEFVWMPFGLKNTQPFHRFMDQVMRGLPFCYVYIDYLLIASKTPDQYIQAAP